MRKEIIMLSAFFILSSFSIASGGSLYLVNSGAGRVDIYDTVLRKKTSSIAAGGSPVKAALSPGGGFLAVTQKENPGEWPEAVWILDMEKRDVSDKVNIILTRYRKRGEAFPVFSRDSMKLYTSETETGFLNVIDTSNYKLVKKLSLGVHPLNPVLSPDGKRLYVPCLYSGAVAVVDTDNDLVVDKIKIDGQPSAVAVDPAGKLIYVADRPNNNVWAMDVETGSVVNKYAVGSRPENLMLINAEFLYVLNTNSNTMSVIDLKKSEEVRSMGIGLLPTKMAIDAAGMALYVVSEDLSISVVDLTKNERQKSIPIDSIPTDIVFVP